MSDAPLKSPNVTAEERSILARLAKAVRNLRGRSIRESLADVIEESDRDLQELSAPERLMLANLLQFGALKVGDVMVPRGDIVAVEEQTSLSDLVAAFREAQHSRLPLYRETLDDPLGMIHIKDVLTAVEMDGAGQLRFPAVSISKFRRQMLFVPAAMPALDLLMKMQASHIHLALVVDEYGGTDGLVSIEDLVEKIVGDIDDEHDVDETPEITKRPDGGFEAHGRVGLEEFKDQTGIDLTQASDDEDIDTLGGLVFSILGRVPARGEVVSHPQGYEFEVLEVDPRRVKRLRIKARPQGAGDQGDAA